MRPLVVGCPVRERAWILPSWFAHMREAVGRAGADEVVWVFACGPGDDDTLDILKTEAGDQLELVEVDEPSRIDMRLWTPDRVDHMVAIRNRLLARVRELDPLLFWSVDSDILVHPEALSSALAVSSGRGWAATGSRCYMSEVGTSAPSCGTMHPHGGMARFDAAGAIDVDIIMAIKVMTPAAYKVDYEFNKDGEDLGWSKRAKLAGLKLGWDGTYVSKHVMRPEALDQIDDRVGW